MRNSARYSSTFQLIEEYLPARPLISNAATRNQDQCRNTSTPARRNRRIDPWRRLVIRETYSTGYAAREEIAACLSTEVNRRSNCSTILLVYDPESPPLLTYRSGCTA